jgi:glycosyltransferase involved in cell wall biosynthesis
MALLPRNARYVFVTISKQDIGNADNSLMVWYNDAIRLMYKRSHEIVLSSNYVIHRDLSVPLREEYVLLILNFNALLHNINSFLPYLAYGRKVIVWTVLEGTELIVSKDRIDWYLEKLKGVRILSVSTYCKEVMSRYGFEVAGVLPNIIGSDKFDLTHIPDYSERSKERPFVFVCVSTNAKRKNVSMLIRAFRAEFENEPDVELHLRVDGIESMAVGNVVWVPRTNDLAGLYRSGHAVVLASSTEGFGMPVLEGLLTGLPAVVPFHTGLRDFVNTNNALPVKYKVSDLPEAERDPGILGEIYDVDENDLRVQMRKMLIVAARLSASIDRGGLYQRYGNPDAFFET